MAAAPPKHKPVIALVGGIGAGKSTAAAELVALGCRLVDTDAIGHGLLAVEDVRDAFRRRWGEAVFAADGSVDRRAVAARVFPDPDELAALNAILHPRIRRSMEQQIAEALADADTKGVVVDAAVLFEAGWDDLCTHKVFVSAPAAERQRRAAVQRGWDEETWRLREKSQISLDKKAGRSDYTVDNRSGASLLREQIRQLFRRITEPAV
jgi:dephospho-CoA kinase